MFQILTTLYLLLLLSTFSLCTLVNVSIDDQLGDERTGTPISYSFGWSFGPNCTDCEAAVDPGQVFDRTWHDTSFAPAQFGGDGAIRSAGASFNGKSTPHSQEALVFTFLLGTAVYVVCILTHGFSNPNGNTDMAFFLDGVQAGSLEQPPNGDATYLYNQVVFSKTGLSSGVHNIRIDVGHNGTSALILFDRIIYTLVYVYIFRLKNVAY